MPGIPALAETLVAVNNSHPGVAREYVYNLTNGPIVFEGVSISNYTNDLQIYTNTSQAANNATGVKFFTNFCSNNKTAGAANYLAAFQLVFAALNTQLQAQAANVRSPLSLSLSLTKASS